ncbi:MAG: hypothetical protein LH477_12955 [Nocardioides sp.]|nr:hypothetical protein [Nocardioides sp.]
MLDITRYDATLGGHAIVLEFDQKLAVLNRARLLVDGVQIDEASVVYGERELEATLVDGVEVKIRLHSRMLGELTRAQLRGGDGSWVDLTPGTARAS